MYVAFYRVDQPKATLLDTLIGLVTFSKFSHVEICDDNGECFSVSPRENCVREKKINIQNSLVWKLVEVPIDSTLYTEFKTKWLTHKYDYPGALTSPLPVHVQFENKVFCSELITKLLVSAKVIPKVPAYSVSPGRLYRILKKTVDAQE